MLIILVLFTFSFQIIFSVQQHKAQPSRNSDGFPLSRGIKLIDWLSSVLRPRQHSIGYMGDGFYRSKDPTNSITVLKEEVVKEKYPKNTQNDIHKISTASPLVYNYMGWLRDSSHRGQGCQWGVETSYFIVLCINLNKKAQLMLTNPRNSKKCKNCSNSTCFVSFYRIPFP